MPISIVFFLLIYGLITKKKKRKKRTLIVGVVLLYIFCNNSLMSWGIKTWEKPVVPIKEITKSYDLGIILTGVAHTSKEPHDRVYLGQGADRVLHPVLLYKKGIIKNILITGGSGSLIPNERHESEDLKKLLITCGIPSEKIITETNSRNTRENAVFTAEIIQREYDTNVETLLITSAFHMRRSLGCFEAVGIICDPFPVDFRGDIHHTFDNLFLPKEEALHKSYVLVHEIAGYIIYALMGYI